MNITIANLGWILVAWLLAGAVFGAIQDRLSNQYEFKWFRVTRRWYGTNAHVCLKSGGRCPEKPDRFQVLAWDGEHTEIPWLLVRNIDFAGYMDFGPPRASWYPVT